MIAIAGSKGGCGKTTVTLGVTEALARVETTAIAVDADRQLPNVHVMAGTDRTPTLGAFEGDESTTSVEAVTRVAQQSPRNPNARFVSAPKASETVDFQRALDRFETAANGRDLEILLDCPSGAGPDLVEPLSAASGVLIVTTDAERSLVAAETTRDIADRLGVPVLGVICNRCESPPPGLESRLGADVLGTIPEVQNPITDEAAVAGFDDVAAELVLRGDPASKPTGDTNRLATGIDVLDRILGGGLPAGSVVVLSADAASQSEHLLYAITATRGTLYLTTERSVTGIERALERSPVAVGKPSIRSLEDGRPLEHALELIEKLPDGANLLVDPIDRLETVDRERYLEFLNTLANRLAEIDGIALLHCLATDSDSANRRSTKHVADVALDVHTTTPGWDVDVNQYLSVSKCRFDSSPVDTVELDGELTTETAHENRPVVLE